MKNVTIVSIDTGDPGSPLSTTAFVKIVFDGSPTIRRTLLIYTGTFRDRQEKVLEITEGADHIVIEQIDSTNKFIERRVIAEQLALRDFLKIAHKDKVQELVRSGRKQVITDALLQRIHLYEDNYGTHHHDVREATRNLLYFMAKSKELNPTLSNYVRNFFK